MRRVSLDLLRCPRCREGALSPDSDAAELIFGPLRCSSCKSTFPVAEGVADVLVDRREFGLAQRGMEHPWVARAYERYLRPALHFSVLGRHFDRESEFLLYRSLLGKPAGAVLDLGCGTGLFTRMLASHSDFPWVIGLDRSRPMIEEAVAQSREHGVMVDFCRAEAPKLPFQDRSLGAVLQSSSLHFMLDEAELFSEVLRVLKPGGIYVAGSYLPPRFGGAALHRKVGLVPRSAEELERAMTAAGFHSVERLSLPPLLVIRAASPSESSLQGLYSKPGKSIS